jgi:UDP-N-acetylmuramoyl-L-alanyl-D-glutamate--2,6-diaminopimelate ligase
MDSRRNVRLSQIAQRLDRLGLLAGPAALSSDPVCTGCTDDSRRVRPGDLFCAVRGTRDDGHRYLKAAAGAGAVGALVEAVNPSFALPQVPVRDSRRATAHAAQVVFGDPGEGLTLIGVTGTNGKTTTVQITRHLCSARGPAGSVGTLGVGTPDGGFADTGLTTPGPVEFTAAVAALRDAGARTVVAEVSSHALRQSRVDGFSFDVAVFTNLTQDHLDYHTDTEDYRRSKLRLATLVRGDGTLVVNADDPAWAPLLEAQPRVETFGLRAHARWRAEDVQLLPTGSRFRLHAPEGTARIELPLVGAVNVANALAAAAAAGAVGLDVGTIAQRLANAPAVPGRLERLTETPVLVLRDYAHTADAIARALAAVRPLTSGRVCIVFGAGGDRDRGKRPAMGRAAAEGADHCIVTSDNPRTEDPEAIVREIVAGLPDGTSYESIVDRREAIARALERARPGDLVLLAGKGHETTQVVGERKIPFDEREIVRELLEGRGKA